MKLVACVLALAALSCQVQAQLFGTSRATALEKISNDGTVTPFAPAHYEEQAQQLSAIDSDRQRYYIVGYNASSQVTNLVGFDTTNGDVVVDAPLPFQVGAFVGVGQQLAVEPKTGAVIVGGRLVEKGPHVLGVFDPTSRKFTQVAALNASDLPVLGATNAYDPLSQTMYFQLGIDRTIPLLGLDMSTGEVSSVPLDPEEGRTLTTLDWDVEGGRLVGLGIAPSSSPPGYERTIASYSPASKTWDTIGVVDGWLGNIAGLSALDNTGRDLWWVGHNSTEKNVTAPWYLLQMSLKDASVKSAAVVCDDPVNCPWSLELQN